VSLITRAPEKLSTADGSCRTGFCFLLLPISSFPTPIDTLRRDTDTSCRTPREPAGAVRECAVMRASRIARSRRVTRRTGCVFSHWIEGELHVELLFCS
jgi:hypothetical protein